MGNRHALKFLIKSIIISCALFIVLLGCAPEPKVVLTDGYVYFRNFGTVHSIAKPDGEILVFGDVENAWEIDRLIVGKRIPIDPPIELDTDSVQPYGYFIFNKETGNLIMGLEQKDVDIYTKK